MQTSSRNTEGTRTERVKTEGVELHINVTMTLCNDGMRRDIVDPFLQVMDGDCLMALALSGESVSSQGIQDAILVALTPNRDSDS